MAKQEKVFISSVFRGMEPYRQAVKKVISSLEGYEPIMMEEFGARDDTPYNVSMKMVKECTLFIGIVGHQYGSIYPLKDKSYSELEYDRAVKLRKRRLMFVAPDDFPIQAALIENDDLRNRQRAFRQRVLKDRQAEMNFKSKNELAKKVELAIKKERKEVMARQAKGRKTAKQTRLLFPFVTNQAGFDTGITISNVSLDPISTASTIGGVRLFFYGNNAPSSKDISPIAAGQIWSGLLSGLAPNFQGYIIAICNFLPARGYAMIADQNFQSIMSGYPAEVTEFETELPGALKD